MIPPIKYKSSGVGYPFQEIIQWYIIYFSGRLGRIKFKIFLPKKKKMGRENRIRPK